VPEGNFFKNILQKGLLNESEPAAFWNFHEISDDKICDLGPQKHETLISGTRDFALDFDGKVDFIDFPDSIDVGSSWTLECRFKYSRNFGKNVLCCFTDYVISIDHGRFAFTGPKGATYLLSAVKPGLWHHCAIVYEKNTQTVYINGEKIHSDRFPNPMAKQNMRMIWGKDLSNRPDRYFSGQIKEFRIWNQARHLEDIVKDRHHYLTGWESGLSAYWPLAGATGDSAMDVVGRKKGTIHGTVWATASDMENIALHKPVEVSSIDDGRLIFKGDNAVDGLKNTLWSSAFSDQEWISVNLGGVGTIQHIVFDWASASAKRYEIQVSQDNVEWMTIYFFTRITPKAGWNISICRFRPSGITFECSAGSAIRQGVIPYGISRYGELWKYWTTPPFPWIRKRFIAH